MRLNRNTLAHSICKIHDTPNLLKSHKTENNIDLRKMISGSFFAAADELFADDGPGLVRSSGIPGSLAARLGPENQNHGCGQWGLAGWGGNSGDHDAGFAEEESHTLYRFATVDS